MTKNNYWFQRLKNHKVSVSKVVVCLALIILVTSFALIQGFAYQLPIAGGVYGTVADTGGYLAPTFRDMLYTIVRDQIYCGSFNNFEVVAVYYYSANEIRVIATFPGNQVRYSLIAGTFEPSTAPTAMRFQLTERGFQGYYTSSAPSVTEENMLMYRNTDGELVVNSNIVDGTAQPSEIITAYSLWTTARNEVAGGNTQDAYNEGYQDGYDDGRQEGFADGRETGYAEGYSTGYDAGLSVGGGENIVITEEIDVGSLITALPQAARNIIDGAFGFTIFGINIAATLIAILVVAIVAFIVRWLLKR